MLSADIIAGILMYFQAVLFFIYFLSTATDIFEIHLQRFEHEQHHQYRRGIFQRPEATQKIVRYCIYYS